jgi:hypothetical protein
MNLEQNRIGMGIIRLARSPRSPAFRIPKPFLIEFITASSLVPKGDRHYTTRLRAPYNTHADPTTPEEGGYGR